MGSGEGSEESLSTLLNEDQRGELTLLLAMIMSAMRKTLASDFDANLDLSKDFSSNAPLVDEKASRKETDIASADVSKLDAERKLMEQRKRELSAPRMRELKEASFKFFDEWRTKVIGRVGEVVNSKQKSQTQLESARVSDSKTHAPEDTKIDAAHPRATAEEASHALNKLFPPIETPLTSLPEKSRILVVHSVLLIFLSLEHYYAPSRILMLYLVSSLRLPLKVLEEDEEKVAKGLLDAAKQMSGDAETQKRVNENKDSRKWKVGLASVAGAALIGVTGGLAAPLVAAGVGSLMGGLGLGATAAAGYLGAVAGSSVIVGGLFGAYGGRMTGQMMDKYAREVEDFAFIPVHSQDLHRGDHTAVDISTKNKAASVDESQKPASSSSDSVESGREPIDPAQRRLRITIGISGWLTSKSEVVSPWRVLGDNSEVFALRWELDALMQLGNSLNTMVSHAAWGYAKTEILQRTVLAELMTAAAWPLALLHISRVVDNPFSIAKARADKAGEVLADALINKAQGERPVSLIGYSLGARVIYSCLTSLARRRAFGLVESAVLIGAPTPATTADWRLLRSVVAGRLVNVYSVNDYILGFLYRTSSVQYGIAGLQKVQGIPSVENVDVSETVTGHLRYRYLVGSILKKIGVENLDLSAVDQEDAAFQRMIEEEKKRSYASSAKESGQKVLDDNPLGIHTGKSSPDDKGQITQHNGSTEKPGTDPMEDEVRRLEQEIREKTKQQMS